MKITLCSSASFYKQVCEIKKQLQTIGFEVLIPHTANQMEASGDYRVETYKTWFADPKHFDKKTSLMQRHLAEVDAGDVVLVVNLTKNSMAGYIGGNVLLEMFYGWLKKKPIYCLYPISQELPLYEEVMGFSPICLNGDWATLANLMQSKNSN
ncbi:MAG: hypothetical protein Q7S68_03080 [Deltaproteobacteria bacterium]|nr:hypothetical protein [Deltaproteobacteria bacterium]